MARLMLLGLLIAVAASGCGGAQHNKGARRAPAAANFDANATFACLLKRPEYSPSLPTGNVLRFTDVGGHPTPIPKHLPLSSITLGTGMDFDISFTGSSVPGGGFMFVDFKFFDDVQAARAWRSEAVTGAEGNGFPAPRKAIQLERNLVIDWSNGGVPPSRRLNSIVHGCLRTH